MSASRQKKNSSKKSNHQHQTSKSFIGQVIQVFSVLLRLYVICAAIFYKGAQAAPRKSLADICTTPLHPIANKPRGQQYGVVGGKLTTYPHCIQYFDGKNDPRLLAKCQSEVQGYRDFTNNKQAIDAAAKLEGERQNSLAAQQKAFSQEIKTQKNRNRVSTIMANLNPEQKKVFNELGARMDMLSQANIHAGNGIRAKFGNCEEQVAFALKSIISNNLLFNIKSISRVELKSSNTGKDHIYYIIDGKNTEQKMEVTRNPARASALLKSVGGNICDPWNFQFILASENDPTHLHDPETGGLFDSATIEIVWARNESYETLTSDAQSFLCERLFETELTKKPKSKKDRATACSQFFNPKSEEPVVEDVNVEQLEMQRDIV